MFKTLFELVSLGNADASPVHPAAIRLIDKPMWDWVKWCWIKRCCYVTLIAWSAVLTSCVGESGVVVATGNVSSLFEGRWTSSCTEAKLEELSLPRPAIYQWVLSDGVSELRVFFYRNASCGGEPREAQVFRGYVTVGTEPVSTESGIPAFPTDFLIDPNQSTVQVVPQTRLGVMAIINNLLYMSIQDMTAPASTERTMLLNFSTPFFPEADS